MTNKKILKIKIKQTLEETVIVLTKMILIRIQMTQILTSPERFILDL